MEFCGAADRRILIGCILTLFSSNISEGKNQATTNHFSMRRNTLMELDTTIDFGMTLSKTHRDES